MQPAAINWFFISHPQSPLQLCCMFACLHVCLHAGPYGYQAMGAWDLLYSPTAKAVLAADLLRPGQLLACVPGFLALTRKTTLVTSMVAMYGAEKAWQVVPRWDHLHAGQGLGIPGTKPFNLSQLRIRRRSCTLGDRATIQGSRNH